jgi:threonine dehydratase
MKRSLEAGHPVTLEKTGSIADGLMPVRPGDLTFAHARAFVDEVVLVEDAQIAEAVLWLFREGHMVVEPSGAATIAAVLATPPDPDAVTVAVLSGGNIAIESLAQLVSAAAR